MSTGAFRTRPHRRLSVTLVSLLALTALAAPAAALGAGAMAASWIRGPDAASPLAVWASDDLDIDGDLCEIAVADVAGADVYEAYPTPYQRDRMVSCTVLTDHLTIGLMVRSSTDAESEFRDRDRDLTEGSPVVSGLPGIRSDLETAWQAAVRHEAVETITDLSTGAVLSATTTVDLRLLGPVRIELRQQSRAEVDPSGQAEEMDAIADLVTAAVAEHLWAVPTT